MKGHSILIYLSLLMFLTNCNDGKEEKKGDTSSKLDIVQLSTEIESSVIDAYMKLKDSLIESDTEKASSMAEDLSKVLKAEEKELKELSGLVDQLAAAQDIEQQRQYFSSISENLYTLIKHQDNHSITIYKQYCPMAFQNEGAFWLSREEAIINPYFGDKMLKCGKVQEIIVASN